MSRSVVRKVNDRTVFVSSLPARGLPGQNGSNGTNGINGGVGSSAGFAALFAAASGMAVGAGITRIKTDGHTVAGVGGAEYQYDAAITALNVGVGGNVGTAFLAADGRGFRLDPSQRLTFDMFGAVPGDYATGISADCLPAWNMLQAWLTSNRRNTSLATHGGAPQIAFPGAQYYFSDTLQMKHTMRLTGYGSGLSGAEPTWLRFAADKAGIVVNRPNTLGDAEQSPAVTGGDGSIIEGFLLQGNQGTTVGTTTDLLKSGIRLRTRVLIRDVTVRNFAGAGICISARTDVAASDPFYGNANNWQIHTARIEGNRAGGVYVSGGDANVGTAIGVDCTRNGRYNFFDGAFLGNAYYGCHSDVGGLYGNAIGSTETSHVSHSGTRYFLAYGVSHATAIATTPGTNEAVWKAMGAGGVDSQWKAWSATPAELYVPGGSYYQTGSANKAKYDGCYYEINHAPPQIMGAGIVDSGFMTEGLQTGGPHLIGSATLGLVSQRAFTQKILYSDASWTEHAVGGDQSGNTVPVVTWNSSVSYPSDPNRKSSWLHDKVTGDVWINEYNINVPLFIAGYSTARTYGARPQAEARYTVEIPNLHIGTGNDGNRITSGGLAPTTGYHRRGDIHFNNGTGNGTNHTIFYYCSASGTPGTWLRFAQLVAEPSLAIGYQTGAGGTNTQATSKSTGVTIHKPCGQVTMNAASLAAGAAVSFTLTSNNIAANDTVVVNIASGASADSYELCVTAVGATTCRIQLRNISAGSLAEALVLNFAVIKGAAS